MLTFGALNNFLNFSSFELPDPVPATDVEDDFVTGGDGCGFC